MTTDDPITRFTGPTAYLSNFYACKVLYQGRVYKTAEHAFQAAKTLDVRDRTRVALAESPAMAKRIGRQVEMRPHWEHYWRYRAMAEIIGAKFNTGFNRDICTLLVRTGDRVLIEGNRHHDNLWGDCDCHNTMESRNCRRPGANILGWMLMNRREELIASGTVD